ncbi:MAG: tyrosine-type recombinase/integrase [Armatimonadota bacterium]|jgi:site-specific recombinase XerD
MKARALGFHSFLARDFEAFLAYKRALARRYDNEEHSLRLFDRYLVEQGVRDLPGLTADTVQAFLTSRPRTQPRSYNHLLGVVRRFFAWLVIQERAQHSPVQTRARRTTSRRTPFLFDQAQARHLLEAAAQLPDNARAARRGEVYAAIFALLYGLGLRVGEVARLRRGDVDLDRGLLVIRHTKFGKSRLVPFGPRLARRLREYLDHPGRHGEQPDPDSPVFSFTRGRCLRPETISQVFHHLVARLGLVVPPGVAPPCVHCLRHSFAVGTLLRWYRAGLDPAQRLFHLSTFLGHADPASTSVYLTVTMALLQEANRRFERLVSSPREEG